MPIIFLKTQNSFEKNNITRDNNLKALLLAFIAIFFVAAIAIPKPSMAVHKGAGNLVCGQCHTMHNSQGGTNLEGNSTGSILLLRGAVSSRAELHKLCLQCHAQGGAQANIGHSPHGQLAPKVYGANWNQDQPFGNIGAGGDFINEFVSAPNFVLSGAAFTNARSYGHSPGLTSACPPGNPNFTAAPCSTPSITLTCTTCHDPHGTTANNYNVNVYRNLLIEGPNYLSEGAWDNAKCGLCHNSPSDPTPFAPGELWHMKSWIGGITGQYSIVNSVGANYFTPVAPNGVAIWPVYKNDALSVEQNLYDGISDQSDDQTTGANDMVPQDGGMGEWCARCHPKFHESTTPGSTNPTGADWMRHPVNNLIDDVDSSGAGVDTIDWNHYDTEITCGAGSGCFKVPAANGDRNDWLNNTGHYYADANNEDKVFCLTCHFAHAGPYFDALRWDYLSAVGEGSQTGNGVPSNRGCQQCHNR